MCLSPVLPINIEKPVIFFSCPCNSLQKHKLIRSSDFSCNQSSCPHTLISCLGRSKRLPVRYKKRYSYCYNLHYFSLANLIRIPIYKNTEVKSDCVHLSFTAMASWICTKSFPIWCLSNAFYDKPIG